MAQLHVKIFMGSDVRRRTLTAPFTFDVLRAAVLSVAGSPHAKIHFIDDDGDLVLIESDAEFTEARRCSHTTDSLNIGVGPDGAASLAAASQLKKLGASVNINNNNNNNTSTVSTSTAFEQSPKPRTALSAPPTPAAAAVAPAATAEDRNLKQLVEAAVQEALRGTLPHLQASIRQVDDSERRRVAALEQQLADVKQQLSESISMVSSMRVQPSAPINITDRTSFVSQEQQLIDAQLAEALRLSRAEAQEAEAKAVAEKLRVTREEAAKEAAKEAAEAAARAQKPPSSSSPFAAAAPLFESLFVNRDGVGSATVDIGALLAGVASSSGALELLPFVKRFLQHPNDQSTVEELAARMQSTYVSSKGAVEGSAADVRRAIQQALRYVQQRPHVREFLAEVVESAPLGALLRMVSAGVAPATAPPSGTAFGDQSLIASFRDDVAGGRVVCDECHNVIRGTRYKCTTCSDFDLCAPCESTTQHNPEHALLKVRPSAGTGAAATPAATPAVIAAPPAAVVPPVENPPAPATDPADASSATDGDQQAAAHAKLRGYRAALVRDVTLPDGARVRPGASLTKVWRLQNSGSAVWPSGSTLGFVGGSDFGALPTAISDGVEPGGIIDVTLRCTAPQRPGRYIGYWRLIDARGAPFGERIWLDVDVDGVEAAAVAPATPPPAQTESWTVLAKAIEASQEKERLAKEEREREAEAQAKADSARREAAARAKAEQQRLFAQQQQLLQQQQQQQQKQLLEQQKQQAAQAIDRQYADKLRQLAAMGFTGDRVRVLIAKHNGNVLAVVQELLEDGSVA
jgi:hypothetical protein